jgi:hypothetical protein
MTRRLSTIVGFVGVASALALLSAPSAVAAPSQAQTVTFTSAAPQGKDWFNNGYGSFFADYTAMASASSGLPVTLSIDPASTDVCRFYDPGNDSQLTSPSPGYVQFWGAGTCTIHADQAGNDEYLPAEQASQSFVLDKVQSKVAVLRQRNWPLRKRTFRATLEVPTVGMRYTVYWDGYPGQVVTFSLAGHPVCSGTTNAGGVATCTATLSARDWLRYTFVASYAGDANYKPISRNGPTYGDSAPVQPSPY